MSRGNKLISRGCAHPFRRRNKSRVLRMAMLIRALVRHAVWSNIWGQGSGGYNMVVCLWILPYSFVCVLNDGPGSVLFCFGPWAVTLQVNDSILWCYSSHTQFKSRRHNNSKFRNIEDEFHSNEHWKLAIEKDSLLTIPGFEKITVQEDVSSLKDAGDGWGNLCRCSQAQLIDTWIGVWGCVFGW